MSDLIEEIPMLQDALADEVVSRLIPRLETLAGGLSELLRKTVFTDVDVALIREHVRPKDAPDAVEAAVLRERIRCARTLDEYVNACDVTSATMLRGAIVAASRHILNGSEAP
jgi:hypothetical protein